MKRSPVIVLAAALVALLAVPALGAAMDHHRLQPGDSFEKSYPPIPGMFPNAVTYVTVPQCEMSDACDLISIDLLPDSEFGHRTFIELHWPDPSGTNDLDLYLWDEDGTRVDVAATADNPELLGGETGMPDMEPGRYLIGVVNFAGVNSGYTLKGAMVHEEINVFRGEEPPAAPTRAPARETPAEPPAPEVETPRAIEPAEAAVAPEEIPLPGADGDAATWAMDALPAGMQSQPAEGGMSLSSIVFLGLTILVAAGGAAAVVLRIRRELSTG